MSLLNCLVGVAFIASCGCNGASSTSGSLIAKPSSTSSRRNTREVKVAVKELTLEGTLQIPDHASGKVPAILLLPGSGPTDRDGNSGLGITTDVLKQIAEELAKNGIASLRFDKRAIAHYREKWPKTLPEVNKFFAWEKFVDDAKACFDYLATQPEIDKARVGILGHSEGALISLQIGSDRSGQADAPKITISLGGTGRPMGPIIHEQIERSLKKSGLSQDQQKTYLDYTDNACKALAAGQGIPPNTPKGLESLFNPTASDIMGAYCRIDPATLAKKVQGAALIINGAHDTQVSAERDAPKLIAALQSRKSGIVDSLIALDTSHNLKTTKDGNDDNFTGPVVPEILAKIVDFAKKNL